MSSYFGVFWNRKTEEVIERNGWDDPWPDDSGDWVEFSQMGWQDKEQEDEGRYWCHQCKRYVEPDEHTNPCCPKYD